MPVFTEQLPAQQIFERPIYEQNPRKRLMLSLLGYKPNGQTNAWGKFLTVTQPYIATGANMLAQRQSTGDTKANIADTQAANNESINIRLGLTKDAIKIGGAIATGGASGAAAGAGGAAATGATTEAASGGLGSLVGGNGSGFLSSLGNLFGGSPSGTTPQSGDTTSQLTGLANALPLDTFKSLIPLIANPKQYKTNMSDDISRSSYRYTYASGGKAKGLTPKKARTILHDGTVYGRKLTDKQRKFFGAIASGSPVKNADGGEMEDYSMIYPESDKETEDIEMTDKATGLKVGEMRYGERIFSQMDNITMETLARNCMTEALGEFVAKVIQKQDMQQAMHEAMETVEIETKEEKTGQEAYKGRIILRNAMGMRVKRYADGGIVPPGGTPFVYVDPSYKVPTQLQSQPGYSAFQSWVRSLPQDQVQQILTSAQGRAKDAQAKQLLNSALAARGVNDRLTSDRKYDTVHDAYAQAYLQYLNANPAQPVSPGIGEKQPNPIGLYNSVNANPALPATTAAPTAPAYDSQLYNPSNRGTNSLNDLVDTGQNLLGAAVGYMGASQDMPQYELPADWKWNYNRMRGMSQEGLTPQERAQAADQENTTYAANVNSIREGAGGIQSAGAVLGNLNQAAMNRYRQDNAITAEDANLRRSNLAAFQQTLNQDINYDKQKFELDYAAAQNSINQYAKTLDANLQAIQDRNQMNKMYGEGSQYDTFMKLQNDNTTLKNLILKKQWEDYGLPSKQAAALTEPNRVTLQSAIPFKGGKAMDVVAETPKQDVSTPDNPQVQYDMPELPANGAQTDMKSAGVRKLPTPYDNMTKEQLLAKLPTSLQDSYKDSDIEAIKAAIQEQEALVPQTQKFIKRRKRK